MPTDPYVPRRLEDQPRQRPNLAPGVSVPPAQSWHADRPGDLAPGQPVGTLFGSPGPNVGYALHLAQRAEGRIHLAAHEHRDDAVAVVAEIAMRRAARHGRAPVMSDVDFAMAVLGYDEPAGAELFEWRRLVVRGAHHDYVARRMIVDGIPGDLLDTAPEDLPRQLQALRAALRRSWTAGAVASG